MKKKIDWDEVGYETQPPADFTPPQGVALYSMADALKLLDQWIAAYDDLKTDWARTHHELWKAKLDADGWRTLSSHFEFLWDNRDKLRDTV